MRPLGLILAGGEGKRIGGKKPARLLRGKPLIFWALKPFLELTFEEVMISVRDRTQEEEIRAIIKPFELPLRLFFVYDSEEFWGRGPLCGIFSALAVSPEKSLLIVTAVDQPFVSPELLRHLLILGEAHYPKAGAYVINGSLEPFPAVFSSELKEVVREFLITTSENSVKALFSYLSCKDLLVTSENWLRIDPDRRSFININTLDELKVFDDVSSSN